MMAIMGNGNGISGVIRALEKLLLLSIQLFFFFSSLEIP